MVSIRQYDQQLLTQLRGKVHTATLLLLVVLSTLIIMFDNLMNGVPPLGLLGFWLYILLICTVSFQVREQSLMLATNTLFIGLLMAFAICARSIPPDILLPIIPIFLPIVTLLFGRRYSLLLTLAAIGVVIISLPQNMSITQLIPHLAIVCVAYLTILITYEGFYDLLTVMRDYQQYSLEQMRDARDSRAVLAKRTKSLAEATENLAYANRQLRIAKRKVEEAQKLKSQFAANVSHELRTPINLVVGFAETIVRFPNVYGTPLPAAYLSDIRTIYRNGKHLQSLINDVLDISQIEAGHMAIIKEEVSISTIIQETARMMHDQITHKGLSFVVDIPDDLPVLWLDRVRIRQVFINLLGNAIRFTDEGTISVSAQLEGNRILICVADTGIGIVASEQEHIFEEFYQTHHVNRRGEGSGLGLTLSRRFVRIHNGDLWAESEGTAGEGSKFWIQLPLENQSQLAKTGVGRAAAIEKRSLLVCNDDAKVLEFFERHLKKQDVISVRAVEDAAKFITANPAAIVVDTDDLATGKWQSVIDIAQQHLPIITCAMPSGRRYMQDLGVADYLVKPVSVDSLSQSLAQFTPQPHHILIVDDDKEIVRLFRRLLTAIMPDCQLTMAYGGQEALALLETQAPDLVILDILMPDIDGLTVLEWMKSSDKVAHIPVIIASAKGASEAISPSDDGRLHIEKPTGFQPMELVQCIEAVVDSLNPLIEDFV